MLSFGKIYKIEDTSFKYRLNWTKFVYWIKNSAVLKQQKLTVRILVKLIR